MTEGDRGARRGGRRRPRDGVVLDFCLLMQRAERLGDDHHKLNTFQAKWPASRLKELEVEDVREVKQLYEVAVRVHRAHHGVFVLPDVGKPDPTASPLQGEPFWDPNIGLLTRYSTDVDRALMGFIAAVEKSKEPLPATVARSVVRDVPMYMTKGARDASQEANKKQKRPKLGHDAPDAPNDDAEPDLAAQAYANVRANYDKYAADGVIDTADFTFEDYCYVGPDNFWTMALIAKEYEVQRWWREKQKPGDDNPWRCLHPACREYHATWGPKKFADDSCVCGASFCDYLKAFNIDAQHRWPSFENEKLNFAKRMMAQKQRDVSRLARICHRTLDDTQKVKKLWAKHDRATTPADKKKFMTQILKSKGRYSVETHARALCELNHVLPRALSRFLKNERDAETEPLFKGNLSLMKANARITGSQTAGFEAEVERMGGSMAQRRCRDRMHLNGKDHSVYRADLSTAMARAEANGLFDGDAGVKKRTEDPMAAANLHGAAEVPAAPASFSRARRRSRRLPHPRLGLRG